MVLKIFAICALITTSVVPSAAKSPSLRGQFGGLDLAFLLWTPGAGAITFEGFERTAAGLRCKGLELSASEEQNLRDSLSSGGTLRLLSHFRLGDPSDATRRALVVLYHQIARPETVLPQPLDATVIYVQNENDAAWLIDPQVSMDRRLLLRPSRDKRKLLYEVELSNGRREHGVAWQLDSSVR
jgi:hypothetical protein